MLLRDFKRYPKPVIFALLGSLGAFLAALLGEVLPLSEQLGYGGLDGAAPRSVINFRPEIQRRLDEEGAEEGEIEIALSWRNKNDIDLHCITPDGEHIYFQEKRSSDGGFLDVDMNRDPDSATDDAVEHVRWKRGDAPHGRYEVAVHHFRLNAPDSDPTEYTVDLKWGGDLKTVTGSIAYEYPPVAVCLLLDVSGSMQGAKLPEMQKAACQFIDRQKKTGAEIAVVAFSSQAHLVAPLSNSHAQLKAAVNQFSASGGTQMHLGLREASQALSGSELPSYILLFTDGDPSNRAAALEAARLCRENHTVIGVATRDVQRQYMDKLTGDPVRVFPAAMGNFENAFRQAEKTIFTQQGSNSGQNNAVDEGDLLDQMKSVFTFTYDPPAPTSSVVLILLVGLWAGLLAIGTGIGLVIGQNSILRRPLLTWHEAGLIVGFGLLAGLASGAFGQTAYRVVSGIGPLRWIGQVGGWMVLGGLLAMGISIFVPNMKPVRGLAGGVAGGGIGSLAFLLVGLILGNAPARVIGAALLGLCIGAVIALVDAFFREAWVEIHYGPNEMRTVALGRKPITIGSHREFCTVMARGVPDVALRYTLLEGKISCEDVPAGRTVAVQPGDRRTAGNLQVVVCAAQSTTSPAGTRQAQPAKAAIPGKGTGKGGYQLCVRGRRFPLSVGGRLGSSELAGLETTEPDGSVAEVTAHPRDPKQLGLKNLSKRPWKATMPDGRTNEVAVGKNVRLVSGVQIDFGVLKGVVE